MVRLNARPLTMAVLGPFTVYRAGNLGWARCSRCMVAVDSRTFDNKLRLL
jgi:hypothetical protein